MKWLDWLGTRSLEIGIAASLTVGLVAAYARERHEGRSPTRDWLVNRLLLMPFLALAASAGIDGLGLPTRPAMFATALLSLLAFDALRAMAARGLRKIAGDVDMGAPPAHRPTVDPEAVREIVPAHRPIEAFRDIIPLVPTPTDIRLMLDQIDSQDPPAGT